MTSSLDTSRAVSPAARSRQPGLLLAGDIGGTKTLLAVYSPEQSPRAPLAQVELPSAKYTSLGVMVREFLLGTGLAVQRASFAVAGPVVAGSSKLTNLFWDLDETDLKEELQLDSVHLLNDLEAIGEAAPFLEPPDLYPLTPGEPVAGAPRAVIAPGTGLGEAFLIYDGVRYQAFPSEGGHASFAPQSELQDGLLAHLRRKFDHVSVERVCSGPGLLNIYQYLRDVRYATESPEMARALAAAEYAPPLIGGAAVRAQPDPLSRAALDLFISILGSEAGNLALKVLSLGGVYLAGGIPPRVRPALSEGRFLQAFVAKGRMGALLSRVPVYVVTLRAALLGAALRGLGTDQGAEGRRGGGREAKALSRGAECS
ncbi:MAG TPA: glucokinase [Gemmatimonadales bacterium]|nr:glucokinase [Gemmatimonadales bacterium]